MGLITWKHSECAIVTSFFRPLEATREGCLLREISTWFVDVGRTFHKEVTARLGSGGQIFRFGPYLIVSHLGPLAFIAIYLR